MKTRNDMYIHIGLPKTGTTTLQKHLFGNHSQIHYLGKLGRHGFAKDLSKVVKTNGFFSKMEMKYGENDIQLQSIENQLLYASQNNKKVVLSKEGLAGENGPNKLETAKSFHDNFGDCKIILFVREPESFIKSLYAQMLKSFQKTTPFGRPKWMKLLADGPPHYFDINQWLDACWESNASPKNTMSYADTADIYGNVFGKENIKLFIFEEFVRNPNDLIRKLCDCIGIDAEEGIHLVDGKRENTRLTAGYIERLRKIEQSPALSKEFLARTDGKRNKMLTSDEDQNEKITPILSKSWRDEIHALGENQNRRLVSEWGLPLADYGYRY